MYIHYNYTVELPVTNDIGIAILKILLNFIDSFSVVVFITEIVLKWIDNFRGFWKNPWNIFDFVVTVVVSSSKISVPAILKIIVLFSLQSAVPLIIMLFTNARTSQFAIIAKQLAVFRIVRALKMVSVFILILCVSCLMCVFTDCSVW